MVKNKIPDLTIERLAFYSRRLEMLTENRTHIISSEKLAELCDVSAAQLRKDLAYFGEFGVRGVGYDVEELLKVIRRILATDRDWRLCIVGIGNLGNALLENENFKKRGYNFVAAFDKDPEKIGKTLPSGMVIEPPRKIKELTKTLRIQMGIIATPASDAQRVANMLIDAGIRAILHFAPLKIRTPKDCAVESVDFTVKLENLIYHLAKII
jgi:redox-sensing transcriptional repressor